MVFLWRTMTKRGLCFTVQSFSLIFKKNRPGLKFASDSISSSSINLNVFRSSRPFT